MDNCTGTSNHESEREIKTEIIQEHADILKANDISENLVDKESPSFSWVELCSVKYEKEDEPNGDICNEDDRNFVNYDDTQNFGPFDGFKQESSDSLLAVEIKYIKNFSNKLITSEISGDVQLSNGADCVNNVHSVTSSELDTPFGDHVYPCSYCGITCSSLFYLEKHTQYCRKKYGNVEVQDNAKYVCNICNRAFKLIGHLQRHMRVHTGEKPYQCQICDMKFSQSTNYKRHLRIHTGQKSYECSECGKCFYKLDNLKSHIRVHSAEKEDKPYECVICHAKFSWTGNLRSHMRTHTGERPYGCTVCGMKFNQSGHLSKHMLLHRGERPYKCDLCDAKFCQSVNLQTHMRKHSGEKPYGCMVCEVQFSQSSHLKRHMLLHSGEKPFRCDICGSRFNQSIHLKKHMMIHAKRNEIPCVVIDMAGLKTSDDNTVYEYICNGDTNGS